MKTIFTISILFITLLVSNQSEAQHLEAQAYVQETIIGMQKGYSIKKVTKKGVKMGVFHQSTQSFSFNDQANNYPFSGAELAYPITQCGKVKLYANLKTGIVNNQFIVAIPEIESEIAINQYLTAGIASSVRAGEAAIAFKLNVIIF